MYKGMTKDPKGYAVISLLRSKNLSKAGRNYVYPLFQRQPE